MSRTLISSFVLAGLLAGPLSGVSAASAAGPERAGTPTAAAAAPLPGLERRVAQTTNTTAAVKSIAVKCPSSKLVIGGGADVIGGNGHVVLSRLVPSPISNAYEVKASATRGGFKHKWRLKAYAICADHTFGVYYVTGRSPFGSRNDIGAGAACPAGTKGLGTGISVVGAEGKVALRYGAEPSFGVGVEAVNAPGVGNPAHAVLAHAVCAPTTTFQVPTNMRPRSLSTTQTVTVACPAGLKVHGTGATATSQPAFAPSRPSSATLAAATPDFGKLVLDQAVPSSDLTKVTIRIRQIAGSTIKTPWSPIAIASCA